MRLAEALAERKALDARLSSIEGRLRANARIQEGDAVSEDPERLFALLDSTAEEPHSGRQLGVTSLALC